MISCLVHLVLAFFRLGISTVKLGANDPAQNLEQAGALVPNGQIVGLAAALSNNAAPAFGNYSGTIIPNTPAPATYLAQAMVGGYIMRFSPGAATTDSTDTGTNIVNAIPGAKVGQSFPLTVANLGSGAVTLGSNTGVQLFGTMLIASATARLFLGQVTGSSTISLTNLFAWNLGTGGTSVAGL